MIIGIPKEIKNKEGRVGMTPAGVDRLIRAGHRVCVEGDAGKISGFADDDYRAIGAEILSGPAQVYGAADMIIKVKEPLEPEYGLIKEGQILFAYLHLAPDRAQTEALLRQKAIGIAYETIQSENGALPLLAPMSEIAGRMAVQVGARLLESPSDGRGILLAGVPGVERGNVAIIGGGAAGKGAVKIAVGMGANVTVLDIDTGRLAYLDDIFGNRIQTLFSNHYNIAKAVGNADVVISCVLVPGARAPKLVTEAMVKTMRPGSVLIDIAIDQGGSIETIDRITTHENPYFIKHGIVHYSVANIPGAVPRTSTFALANATLPYAMKIANMGAEAACRSDNAMRKGLNVYKGKLAFQAVADAQGLEYTPAEACIADAQ